MDLQALEANYQPFDIGQTGRGRQPKKPKKDFWLDQLSTAGGVLGGIGGSFLPVPVAGTIGGAAAGSALGEALENVLTGENWDKNVGQEALLGGVFAAPPLRVLGAVGRGSLGTAGKTALGARAGKGLEETGKRLLGTQANLTRAEARTLGVAPKDALGSINKRTGLTRLDQMSEVGKNVTGGTGVLSELTRNAIGNTPGVDLSDLRTLTSDFLINKAPLLADNTKKNVVNQIKQSVVKAYGGSKGSLNPLANPYEAFDVARNFEASAAKLRSGFNASPADKQLADVYSSLAGEIKNRLFAAPGVQEGLDMARPAAADTLRGLSRSAAGKGERRAYDRLAGEVENLRDIGAVRGAQKDFVDLDKISRATAGADVGAAQRLGDNLQGLGRAVQRPTNLIALPLDAATPAVGGALTRLGRGLQGTGPAASAAARPTATGIVGRVGAFGAVRGAMGQTTPQDELDQPQGLEEVVEQSLYDASSEGGSQDPYPRENLMSDIQRDPENADKYLEYYKMIQEVFTPSEREAGYGRPSAEKYSLGTSGLSSLDELQRLIEADSGLINRNETPGQDLPIVGGLVSNTAGTGEYRAVAKNIIDSLARARTGAAMRPEEEAFYTRLLPRAGDNPATIRAKLDQLRGAFAPFVTYKGKGGATSLEDALIQTGAY